MSPHHSAQPRQQAVLRTFNVDRQQRGIGLVRGQRRSFVDFHQRPGDADSPFREHRDPFTGPQMLDQGFQVMRVGWIDADVAGDGDEWSDPPAPGHLGVDHEDRHIRQECRQQRPVQIGDMVGDDQQSGFVMWVMLPAV